MLVKIIEGNEVKVRSSVSADISKGVIWVNSSDFQSTVKIVKIHQILVEHFGYMDSSILEESDRGDGVSLSVLDGETIKQMREDYMYAKRLEPRLETTQAHVDLAKMYQSEIHNNK